MPILIHETFYPYKINVTHIFPPNLISSIVNKLNTTNDSQTQMVVDTANETTSTNDTLQLLSEAEETAEQILKDMMQKCIAVGQESYLKNFMI